MYLCSGNIIYGMNREFLQGLDRDIKTHGHDKILEHYKDLSQNQKEPSVDNR